jgi:hypothetical protein
MAPIAVATVISVAAIAGAIVTTVIAPTRAYADTDADRTCADPNALRACRHCQRNARRSQESDCKFPHGESPSLGNVGKRLARAAVPEKI